MKTMARHHALTKKIRVTKPLSGVTLLSLKTPVPDVITLCGSIFAGANLSPAKNPLVAEVTADMLDEGTDTHTREELRTKLESAGASLSFSCLGNWMRFEAYTTKDALPTVLQVLSEELRAPAFDPSCFSVLKKRAQGILAQSAHDTTSRSANEFLHRMYPSHHPNYEYTFREQKTYLEALTLSQLRAFHKAHYGRGSIHLSAVGDINHVELMTLIKKYFSSLPERSVSLPMWQSKKISTPQKHYITLPDKASIDLMLGQRIYISRHHPDYYPLLLGIEILGGGAFVSRLMREVREKRGLTYGIHAHLDGVEDNIDGHWYIWGTFAPALFTEGRETVLAELRRFLRDGVTKEEVAARKEGIIGSYFVDLSTTTNLSRRLIANAEEGEEVSFIDTFTDTISRITPSQVNQAIKKYVSLQNCTIVAAGMIDTNGKPLI